MAPPVLEAVACGAFQPRQYNPAMARWLSAILTASAIPIAVNDNVETAVMPTTGCSIALAGFMPGRDAFQVQKLREAGAVIIGKTNLHELAAGITSISSLGGQTRNPYDLARNPGGSSGGTGAAGWGGLPPGGEGGRNGGPVP